ncbi:Transcription antiterminator LicT [Sebaldella termitidis]|uniref:Transcriptional antiterminator, BglG n=1 Tax=Sebaldella termitidis (strain ATCC 33386 / NCTC 11300) TaxID=526218 RepID=D1AQP8_SEBTE|nr:PRD domain-containing protein [Sebaldella termitidis]ACZ10308.1 transcriptional antiterminator, BglG [Sebaldella termitidis ATCC 33386]SUI25647.1 Transcription antiterminator LicT [Sebaldella termitidis]
MKISQILNNNVVIVKRGMNEIIVYAKGIAFRKKVGQVIYENEIEKTYVLDSNDMLEHFSYLLSHSEPNHITLVNQIIKYGEDKLGKKSNDYLNLTLLDHIEFALKRAQKGQFIRSPLTWEVKRFYPKHFQIGIYALDLIKEQIGSEFPVDEAVSIALHFVNMEEGKSNLDEAIHSMETLKDIISIIHYHFQITFDENSLDYMRLMTHLQYFIQRVSSNSPYSVIGDEVLNQQIKTLYSNAYDCVQKIRIYVQKKYNCNLTIDEETYLMLHIHRISDKQTLKGEEK